LSPYVGNMVQSPPLPPRWMRRHLAADGEQCESDGPPKRVNHVVEGVAHLFVAKARIKYRNVKTMASMCSETTQLKKGSASACGEQAQLGVLPTGEYQRTRLRAWAYAAVMFTMDESRSSIVFTNVASTAAERSICLYRRGRAHWKSGTYNEMRGMRIGAAHVACCAGCNRASCTGLLACDLR